MIRALLLILEIGLLTAIAVWLADRPGEITINWQGYEVVTSVGVAAVSAFLILILVLFVYDVWRALVGLPGALGLNHLNGRKRRGYLALTQGLVAVAAGDAAAAKRFAHKAEKLLEEPPLTLLLQAQAAQLNGDEEAAAKYFSTMLDRPEMSFLGVRGLLTQSLKKGDNAGALLLARKAYVQQPKAEWVLTALFDLECRNQNWDAALNVLTPAIKQNAIAPDRGRKLRAALWLAQSEKAEGEGNEAAALYHARRAHEFLPAFIPAALQYAKLLKQSGKNSTAIRILERAWRHSPHPALAALYADLTPDLPPLKKVRQMERLKALDTGGVEGPLAVGKAALEARLWGEARAEFSATLAKGPNARAMKGLAELEEKEKADHKSAEDWLERAAAAPAEPAWVCTACHTPHPAWQPLCAGCEAFATLEWKTATGPVRLLLAK